MGSLLAVYDPTGRLGLTDPSPGGGEVPLRWRCSACGHITERRNKDGTCWQRARSAPVLAACGGDQLPILLLRTEDGTKDSLGMARAREVLGEMMSPALARGVSPRDPEALARLLAERAGCEVVRGNRLQEEKP